MRRARLPSFCLCLLALAGIGASLAACGQQAQTPRPAPTPTPTSAPPPTPAPQAFALALQNARVILQYTQLFINDPNTPQGLAAGDQFRDAAMAESIAWLHQHADDGGKMALWAHDGHIGAANRIQTLSSRRSRWACACASSSACSTWRLA